MVLGARYGPKIDLWSLGCVLAELWTGAVLFGSRCLPGLLARVVGVCGPLARRLVRAGRDADAYLTPPLLMASDALHVRLTQQLQQQQRPPSRPAAAAAAAAMMAAVSGEAEGEGAARASGEAGSRVLFQWVAPRLRGDAPGGDRVAGAGGGGAGVEGEAAVGAGDGGDELQ